MAPNTRSLSRRRSQQLGAAGAGLAAIYENRNQLGRTARSVYNYARSRFGGTTRSQSSVGRRVRPRGVRGAAPQRSVYRTHNGIYRSGKTKRSYRYKKRVKRSRVNRKSFDANKYMWNAICTPLIIKQTCATNKEGAGVGLRTWHNEFLGTRADLQTCCSQRPNPTFVNGGVTFGDNHRLCIDKWNRNLTIQNRSNWTMELKIYEVIPRNDISASVRAPSDSMTTDLFTDSDSAVFTDNRGPNQPAYAGAGDGLTNVYQNPTYTPYMSNRFCSLFKIAKTHSVVLPPNEYFKRSFNLYNKSFEVKKVTTGLAPEFYMNWSKFLIFTWVGGPIDTNNFAVTNRQTKSISDLALQWDIDYRFHFEPASMPLYKIGSSNLANPGYVTTNTYNTLTATAYRVPATVVVENAAGADDVAPEHP